MIVTFLAARLGAEQVQFTRNSAQSAFTETIVPVELGTLLQITEPPLTSGNLSFTHWTVNGIRQNAITGQARTAFSWTALGHTTATAHYLPTANDSNANSIQDWMELRLYGHLLESTQGFEYDFDGDGVGHAQELVQGTQPTIPDQPRDGGLMLRLSGIATVRDEAAKKRYEIRSAPQGVFATVVGYEDVGSVKSTQAIPYGANNGYYFGYWEIDGVRQATGTGLALPTARMIMDADHVAVARFFPAGDTDADGIEDWKERYWFGDLAQGSTDDPDADGIFTADEITRGSEPHLHDALQDGGVMLRLSSVAKVRDETLQKRYEIRSEPQGIFAASVGYAATGTTQWTQAIPYGAQSGYYFGYWEIDGVRQATGSGLALPKVGILMNADHVAVARFFPAGDTDMDGIEDWKERYWFGDLAQNGSGDPDGDGISTAEEFIRGSEPHLRDTLADGGVMLRLSGLAKVRDDSAKKRYEIRSEPQGILAATMGYADTGAEQWTQAVPYGATSGYYFGYWEIDGVRQASGSGLSLPKVRMIMDADHVAVARFFPAGDSDSDTMEDWREWYWFGTLAQNGSSDPDLDGLITAEELVRGSEPHLHDSLQDGGIMMRLSGMATKKQYFTPAPMVLVDGVLTELFASAPYQVSNPDRYADLWSNASLTENAEVYPALGDWDGDGDRDFFIWQSDRRLWVYQNIGSSFLFNLSERGSLFEIPGVISGMPASLLGMCLADWDGDTKQDLVFIRAGGNPNEAEVVVVVSPGNFSTTVGTSRVQTVTLPTLPSGQRYNAATVGDLNHDGFVDLAAATGGDAGANRVQVFLGTAHGGMFPATATAEFEFTTFFGISSHVSLAISVEQETAGYGHLFVADTYGTILRIDQFNATGALTLARTDWAASYRDFAQRPRITVGDIDGDADSDLFTGFVAVDADAFSGTIAYQSGINRNEDPRVSAPFDVKASNGAGSILVEWRANREYSLNGYFVYRATAASGPWTMIWGQETGDSIDTTNTLRFADNSAGLAAGTAYYYKVVAVTAVYTKGSDRPTYHTSPASVSNAAYVGAVRFGLSEPVRSPTGQVETSVTLDWGESVAGAGMQLKLTYDATKMRPVRISSGAAAGDLTFTDNRATATGELLINGTSGTLRGKGEILRVYFDELTPAQSDPVARSPRGPGVPDGILTLFVLQIRNSFNQVIVSPPSVQVSIWFAQLSLAGDLNFDGKISDADIPFLLSRIVQGKLNPLAVANLLPVADLDRDGVLNSGDIPLLKRKIREAAGLAAMPANSPTAAKYEVDVMETNGRASDQVSMPLDLSDATGLSAVYLQVNYDRNLLTFTGTQRPTGALGNHFDMTVNETEGTIHIMMDSVASLAAGSGLLANMNFRINPGAKAGMVADVVIAEASLSSDSGAASWWRSKVVQGKGRVLVSLSPTMDTDGDGISDYAEQMRNGSADYDPYDPVTNPSGRDTRHDLADTDGDGLSDGFEITHFLNPVAFGDQLIDNDGDGLNNLAEEIAHTDPNSADTDADGIPDGAEVEGGTSPTLADAENDPDHDGYSNLLEYSMATRPQAPDAADHLPVMTNGLDANGYYTTLSFTRRINNPFVACFVQENAGWNYWHTLSISNSIVGPPLAIGAGLERVTVRVTGPDDISRILRLFAVKRSDVDRDGMPDDFEQMIADAKSTDTIYGPEDVQPGGDFDGDGTSNLLEFIFGMNPTTLGERDNLPRIDMMDVVGHREPWFTFQARQGASDSSYFIEQSNDLLHWQAIDFLPRLARPPEVMTDGTERLWIRPQPSADPKQAVFLRMGVNPSE